MAQEHRFNNHFNYADPLNPHHYARVINKYLVRGKKDRLPFKWLMATFMAEMAEWEDPEAKAWVASMKVRGGSMVFHTSVLPCSSL